MVFCFRFCCSVEAQARAELFYLSILSKTFNNYHFLVERLSTEETISLQTLLWLFKHPVLCKPFFKGLLQNIMLFKMYAYRIWQFYYHISEKKILLQYANNNRILMPPTFLFKFFVKSSFDLDFSQVFLIIKIVQIFLQDTATFFKGNGKGV